MKRLPAFAAGLAASIAAAACAPDSPGDDLSISGTQPLTTAGTESSTTAPPPSAAVSSAEVATSAAPTSGPPTSVPPATAPSTTGSPTTAPPATVAPTTLPPAPVFARPGDAYDPVEAGEPLPAEFIQVLGRDDIQPIYDPSVVDGTQVNWPTESLVIGVTIAGESRAYPVDFLNRHEMIIDRHKGIPTLVTW